jgi:hypothetical protein
MKICIACSHVGQMLFAGNKYLLLKRITVYLARYHYRHVPILCHNRLIPIAHHRPIPSSPQAHPYSSPQAHP